MLYHICLLGW